jgi:hypothetical protein
MTSLRRRFRDRSASFGGLALGQLPLVVGTARAVAVADLGDRGHVDGVVEPPVPAPREPVDFPAAGGHLDRRGAVAGGEVIPVSETGHVAGLADHRGRDDGADTKDAWMGASRISASGRPARHQPVRARGIIAE